MSGMSVLDMFRVCLLVKRSTERIFCFYILSEGSIFKGRTAVSCCFRKVGHSNTLGKSPLQKSGSLSLALYLARSTMEHPVHRPSGPIASPNSLDATN